MISQQRYLFIMILKVHLFRKAQLICPTAIIKLIIIHYDNKKAPTTIIADALHIKVQLQLRLRHRQNPLAQEVQNHFQAFLSFHFDAHI